MPEKYKLPNDAKLLRTNMVRMFAVYVISRVAFLGYVSVMNAWFADEPTGFFQKLSEYSLPLFALVMFLSAAVLTSLYVGSWVCYIRDMRLVNNIVQAAAHNGMWWTNCDKYIVFRVIGSVGWIPGLICGPCIIAIFVINCLGFINGISDCKKIEENMY